MSDNVPEIAPGLVSVIMSNYNTRESYLREAIDSVLAQTYTDIELIIVDDASTDDSPRVIESYRDERIVMIRNKKNMGLAASLNKAMERCRGEFIARMDTDDVCLPQRFERQAEYLRLHPDVIVCGSWVENIYEEDVPAGERISRPVIPDGETYRICLLFANAPILEHPAAMFNHSLLQKNHITYNENDRYAQDYRMWVRCARCARCVNIPEVLLKIRRHRESASHAKKDRQMGFAFQIIQEQLDALHLTLTEEIKPLHYRLLSVSRKPYDLRIKQWIRQIISANKTYKIYHQRKLKKLLWNSWARISYYALIAQSGFKKRVSIVFSVPVCAAVEMIRIFRRRRCGFKEVEQEK